MTCKGLCKDYKARRITTKIGGGLYDDNFRCRTCVCFINPLGTIKTENSGIICTCCRKKVKTKSYKKFTKTVC